MLESATYDDANQTATFSGTSFTHDDNGNLTNDGVRSYTWNARNELASVTGPVNGSFAYDAFGRRRSKTIAGVTTQFLFDDVNPVQELNSGSPTANLLTGLGIDEFLTRTDTAGVRTFLVDALGSTLALADESGTIQTGTRSGLLGTQSAQAARLETLLRLQGERPTAPASITIAHDSTIRTLVGSHRKILFDSTAG